MSKNSPMISGEDIRRYQQENREPEEVVQLRKSVEQSFKNVVFQSEGHKYSIVNKYGAEIESGLPSVSSIIERFVPRVDWEEKANAYAAKIGLPVEQVKRSWLEAKLMAANNGSRVHEFGESVQNLISGAGVATDAIKPQIEEGYLIPFGVKEEAVALHWKKFMAEPCVNGRRAYPLMTEVKMHMPACNRFGIGMAFCGTADCLLAIEDGNGGWEIGIWDYKTNAALKSDYSRIYGKTMLSPFEDLLDEALSKYSIQLSLYAMMLENAGFRVGTTDLLWLREDGKCETIPVKRLDERLVEALKQPK